MKGDDRILDIATPITKLTQQDCEMLYRLERREQALNSLLNRLNNSQLSFDSIDLLKEKVQESLKDCKNKKGNFLDEMYEKYKISRKYKNLKMSFYTGEIFINS